MGSKFHRYFKYCGDNFGTLINQVRDAKIKVLASLRQDSDKEFSEWKKLSDSLKVHVMLLSYRV